MKHRNPERDTKIVEMYRKGYSIGVISERFNITKARVSDIVKRDAPESMRKKGWHENWHDCQ